MKHSESIISNERKCYLTGRTDNLDRHHCFKASRRKIAEEWGCWVYLNHEVHMKLHDHSKPFETAENDLKIVAQEAFEESVGDRELFRNIFGASYL